MRWKFDVPVQVVGGVAMVAKVRPADGSRCFPGCPHTVDEPNCSRLLPPEECTHPMVTRWRAVDRDAFIWACHDCRTRFDPRGASMTAVVCQDRGARPPAERQPLGGRNPEGGVTMGFVPPRPGQKPDRVLEGLRGALLLIWLLGIFPAALFFMVTWFPIIASRP